MSLFFLVARSSNNKIEKLMLKKASMGKWSLSLMSLSWRMPRKMGIPVKLLMRILKRKCKSCILYPKFFWPAVRKKCSRDREFFLRFLMSMAPLHSVFNWNNININYGWSLTLQSVLLIFQNSTIFKLRKLLVNHQSKQKV